MTIHEQIAALENEIMDRKKTLHALRQEITPKAVSDYTLASPDGPVQLSELFGDSHELLVIFNMGKSCSYCTLWADNFNGIHLPLKDRSAFCVVSPDPVHIQQQFAESRRWQFPMYSHENSPMAKDLGFFSEEGYLPGAASFSLHDGTMYIHHRVYFGPGDNYCNMWDFLDIMPRGRNGWTPKYVY